MKYIIDVPDKWVDITNGLHIPIETGWDVGDFRIDTGLKLIPYTEQDREAIEDEVWDFSMKTDFAWISEVGDKPLGNYSYQEAKAKYEEWLKQKAEIRVGDEVEEKEGMWKGVIVGFDEFGDLTIMDSSGKSCCGYKSRFFRKTGRHFDEIEELLKKMGR